MHQIRGKMREKIVKFHNLRSNISSGNLGLFLGPSGGAGSLTSNVIYLPHIGYLCLSLTSYRMDLCRNDYGQWPKLPQTGNFTEKPSN